MIEILVNNDLHIDDPTSELTMVAENALSTARPELTCDFSVNLTTDSEIQHFNFQYRNVDRPTDVLAFESDEVDPESGIRYLGDIVISYPRALQQAADAGHPVLSEIKLLLVHGILHLLGYDHDTPEHKSQMWTLQAKILEQNRVLLKKISGDEEDE